MKALLGTFIIAILATAVAHTLSCGASPAVYHYIVGVAAAVLFFKVLSA